MSFGAPRDDPRPSPDGRPGGTPGDSLRDQSMTHAVRSPSKRLAVLIDADNACARMIEPLLGEVAKYGDANVKRIYGDWTTPNLGSWKDSLNKFAIQPIQQFRYTVGKNASDSALIIDAMDLLHSGRFDGFCIVSSDSDFTRLACRLRESGISVYGFGEQKTPDPFVRACDRFIYVENLVPSSVRAPASPSAAAGKSGSASKKVQRLDPELVKTIRSALEALAPEGDWVTLAVLGHQMLKLSPSFDPRTYGYPKLSDLIRASDDFRLEDRTADGKTGQKQLYVALRSKP
jgi:hypothetical protein